MGRAKLNRSTIRYESKKYSKILFSTFEELLMCPRYYLRSTREADLECGLERRYASLFFYNNSIKQGKDTIMNMRKW